MTELRADARDDIGPAPLGGGGIEPHHHDPRVPAPDAHAPPLPSPVLGETNTDADTETIKLTRKYYHVPSAAVRGAKASAYTGVSFNAGSGLWEASGSERNLPVPLGAFATEHGAAAAYDAWALERGLPTSCGADGGSAEASPAEAAPAAHAEPAPAAPDHPIASPTGAPAACPPGAAAPAVEQLAAAPGATPPPGAGCTKKRPPSAPGAPARTDDGVPTDLKKARVDRLLAARKAVAARAAATKERRVAAVRRGLQARRAALAAQKEAPAAAEAQPQGAPGQPAADQPAHQPAAAEPRRAPARAPPPAAGVGADGSGAGFIGVRRAVDPLDGEYWEALVHRPPALVRSSELECCEELGDIDDDVGGGPADAARAADGPPPRAPALHTAAPRSPARADGSLTALLGLVEGWRGGAASPSEPLGGAGAAGAPSGPAPAPRRGAFVPTFCIGRYESAEAAARAHDAAKLTLLGQRPSNFCWYQACARCPRTGEMHHLGWYQRDHDARLACARFARERSAKMYFVNYRGERPVDARSLLESAWKRLNGAASAHAPPPPPPQARMAGA